MKFSTLLSVVAVSSIIFQTSAQQFPCDGKLYFFRNHNGANWLSYIDQYTTGHPVVTDMCGLTVSDANAMGANPIDHYIYFAGNPNSTLYRIDANCGITIACTSADVPVTDKGCFDNLGRYWVVDNSNHLTAYDINYCSRVKGPFTLAPFSGVDIAFSVADCHFYMANASNVIQIDTNGVLTATYPTGFGGNGIFGGIAIGADGNLYGMLDITPTGDLYGYNLKTHTSMGLVYSFSGGTGNPCGCDMASFACNTLQSNFTASTLRGCGTPFSIQFNNTSTGLVNTFEWDFGDGTSDTSDVNPTHNFTQPGTYNVRLIVNAISGCMYIPSDTFSLSVQVNTLPVASISGTTTICNGQPASLTASGGISYAWSSGDTTSSISVSPGINTNYIVTVTDINGCSVKDSSVVTVNPLPVAAISGIMTICTGQSTSLIASGGINYLWSTGATTDSIVVTPAKDTSYAVTITDANGCTAGTSAGVVVNPLPVVAITGTMTICYSQASLLTASEGTGYLWSTGETTSSINIAPAGNTNYSVTVTDVNGCSAGTSATVIVNPLPVVTISGNMTLCNGQSTSLTATGGTGYLWSTGDITSEINVSPGTSTTYSVMVTDANGCSAADSATVIISPLPVVGFVPFDSSVFVLDSAFVLTGGSPPGGTYSGAGVSGNMFDPSKAGVGSFTLTYSYMDAHGCGSTSATIIKVYSSQSVTLNDIPALCTTSSPVTLSGNPAGGTYSGTGVSGNTFDPSVSGAGTFTITYTYNGGHYYADSSASVTVIVTPAPVVTVSSLPTLGCENNTIYIGYGPQNITLTANSNNTVSSYQWSLNGTPIPGATDATITDTSAGNYSVTITDAGGCQSNPAATTPINIRVVDIRCGNNDSKVVLCHVPPGNASNPQTLCIAPSAVQAHLDNHPGDCLGACPVEIHRMPGNVTEDNNANSAELNIFPNPFSGVTTLEFTVPESGNATLELYDIKGALVKTLFDEYVMGGTLYLLTLDGATLQQGIYISVLRTESSVMHEKLVVAK